MKKRAAGKKPLVGFIGQGYVGKNYANDFEKRGFRVVRYALEQPYRANKEKIKECDIVFIAVPTPTTPKGYDASIVEKSIGLVREGATVVIKSTMLPGTTRRFQELYPTRVIFFSPEYLSVATAAHDAAHPFASIVGTPSSGKAHMRAAKKVINILPKAPFSMICSAEEAEISKYAHNVNGYMQILTFNLMYDMAEKMGANWQRVEQAIKADPYIPSRYASPLHKSGRGAGGACFIKDYAAFARQYKKLVGGKKQASFLKGAEEYNLALLLSTKKDLDLLEGVYGKGVSRKK